MTTAGAPAAAPLARPLPGGRRMLFCVGAQKAGTTWLSANLAPHPACHFAFQKEVHFFDVAFGANPGGVRFAANRVADMARRIETAKGRQFDRLARNIMGRVDMLGVFQAPPDGAQAYLDHFLRDAGPARWLCDFTPDYANLPREGLEAMRAMGERPRFIFLMRDPVDRLWSQTRMLLRFDNVPTAEAEARVRRILRDFLSQGPLWQRPHCNYRRTVAELEAVVPEEDLLILFYEDLFRQESLDRVWDFLGEERRPGDFSVVHEGIRVPFPGDLYDDLRAGLSDAYDFAFERWGDAVPDRWRQRGR
jgi:hypothetical protein